MALYVSNVSEKGRGVFTDEAIEPGTLIEIAPLIVLPPQDREHIDKTEIFNYYFLWGDDHALTAIALGYGSLYNHSQKANAIYESYYDDNEIHFICYRPIKAGEEITINYNNDPNSTEKMWFEQ